MAEKARRRALAYGGGAASAVVYFFVAAALTRSWLDHAPEGRPWIAVLTTLVLTLGAAALAHVSPRAGTALGTGIVVLGLVGLASWNVADLLSATVSVPTLLVTGGQNPFILAFGAAVLVASALRASPAPR